MKIEHVALYVKNPELARDFFIKYFGAVSGELYRNPATGFSSYFLSFDEGARLEIMTRPGLTESAPMSLGYSHAAFSVGGREKVDALAERLAADGYLSSAPRVTGDGYYEATALFEGCILEITE